jgi:flagellar basal body-associated protein FliL
MIASGQRDGIVIILAVILLLLALLAVFMWVQSSRREPLPHSAPPARTEVRIVDSLILFSNGNVNVQIGRPV